MSDKFIFLLANLLDVYSVDYSDELVRRLHYAMQGLIQQFGLGKDYYNYFFENIVGYKKTTKQLLEMLLEECQEEKGEIK